MDSGLLGCFVIIHYALIYVDYLDYIKTCVIKANKSNYIVSVFGVWCKLRILLSIVSRQVTTPGPDTRHCWRRCHEFLHPHINWALLGRPVSDVWLPY